MRKLSTLTGLQFEFKRHPDGELIIYPSDREGNLQNKYGLIVTEYIENLVKKTIAEAGEIKMGASRDNPPKNSLGYIIKEEKQSPQQLSYLVTILGDMEFCTYRTDGKAFVIVNKGDD